ncbi:TPA: hypothetical protein RTW27_002679 [Staphylococcus aureus]|nr:hypothetical protein [Staphylococcus aureus]
MSNEQLSLVVNPTNIDDIISELNKASDDEFKGNILQLQNLKSEYNTIDVINNQIREVNQINVVDPTNHDDVQARLKNIENAIVNNENIAKSETGEFVLNQVRNELKSLGDVSDKYEEIESILKELRKYER